MRTGTARDLIAGSLVQLGVIGPGAPLSASQGSTGLYHLGMLLDGLRLQSLTIWNLVRSVHALIDGKQDYSIGASGADWTLERPDRIASAAVLSGVGSSAFETSLDPLLTPLQWAAIIGKASTSTSPTVACYQPTVPLGTFSVFPVPSGTTASIVLYVPTPGMAVTALNSTLTVPAGVWEMLHYRLAKALSEPFAKAVTRHLQNEVERTTSAVEASNLHIEPLKCDPAMVAGGGGGYDIFTGQYRK